MLIERIPELIKQNKAVALVTVTAACGSTPAEVGKEMLVDASGNIGGTIGGGSLEFVSVKKAQESISRGISHAVQYDLKKDLGGISARQCISMQRSWGMMWSWWTTEPKSPRISTIRTP